MLEKLIKAGFLALLLLSASGCSTVQFYGQAVSGQVSLLLKRRPLEKVIDDPATPSAVRAKLLLAQEVRTFAEAELGLPVGNAYATYADIGRDFVVWNVFVAPEFSVQLESHCFPVAGCVTYRGYFSEAAASRVAESEENAGNDVYVGRVAAYSTLGWFNDPILNTFVRRSDARFAALLFHELAHRALYVKGDTTFNESFATAVERAALKQWLETKGDEDQFGRYLEGDARRREVVSMIVAARESLKETYARDLPPEAMRREKQAVLESLQAAYAGLGEGYPFAAWMTGPLNNARLGTVSEYNTWVPAFMTMLEASGDIRSFIEEVKVLAEKSKAERDAYLASQASLQQRP